MTIYSKETLADHVEVVEERVIRRLALVALSGWLGYHLRSWVECGESGGAWVRTEQGMQCRGRV